MGISFAACCTACFEFSANQCWIDSLDHIPECVLFSYNVQLKLSICAGNGLLTWILVPLQSACEDISKKVLRCASSVQHNHHCVAFCWKRISVDLCLLGINTRIEAASPVQSVCFVFFFQHDALFYPCRSYNLVVSTKYSTFHFVLTVCLLCERLFILSCWCFLGRPVGTSGPVEFIRVRFLQNRKKYLCRYFLTVAHDCLRKHEKGQFYARRPSLLGLSALVSIINFSVDNETM